MASIFNVACIYYSHQREFRRSCVSLYATWKLAEEGLVFSTALALLGGKACFGTQRPVLENLYAKTRQFVVVFYFFLA